MGLTSMNLTLHIEPLPIGICRGSDVDSRHSPSLYGGPYRWDKLHQLGNIISQFLVELDHVCIVVL